jgi:hypothetical protein
MSLYCFFMNIVNFFTALLGSPPSHLSFTEQADWKKAGLGIDRVFETHKLVMGFFLDRYEGSSLEERKTLEHLSHYEWFAGSVTASALCKWVREFVDHGKGEALHHKVKEQLIELVALLEGAQEQSSHIDLIRSNSVALALLALTGNSKFCSFGLDFSADPLTLDCLAENALHKISELQQGKKALFLMGTLQHETLLLINYHTQEEWEVCYYDTALGETAGEARLEVYPVNVKEKNPLLEKDFWTTLYNGSSTRKIF